MVKNLLLYIVAAVSTVIVFFKYGLTAVLVLLPTAISIAWIINSETRREDMSILRMALKIAFVIAVVYGFNLVWQH